jgi:protein phosphatase 1 regulatory subunit 7
MEQNEEDIPIPNEEDGYMSKHHTTKGVVVRESKDEEPSEEYTTEIDYELLQDEFSPEEEEIDLINLRLKQSSFLSIFKNLTRVCLRQNLITEITGLEELILLQDIDLYDNRIDNIKGLLTLKKLVKLDLSFNKIRKIEGLEGLAELKDLFLVSNKIGKIENLETLTSLTMLELGANRIRVIIR